MLKRPLRSESRLLLDKHHANNVQPNVCRNPLLWRITVSICCDSDVALQGVSLNICILDVGHADTDNGF